MWGKGRHINRNASLSQPNVQKISKAQVRERGGGGGGGGLKFEKNAGKNNQAHTLDKSGHRFPCILFFFIHPQPNNVGPAQQQPRALFLVSLNLVGGG